MSSNLQVKKGPGLGLIVLGPDGRIYLKVGEKQFLTYIEGKAQPLRDWDLKELVCGEALRISSEQQCQAWGITFELLDKEVSKYFPGYPRKTGYETLVPRMVQKRNKQYGLAVGATVPRVKVRRKVA
jgi:hypothetical protein